MPQLLKCCNVSGNRWRHFKHSDATVDMKLISKKGFDFVCKEDYIFFIERDENHEDKFFKTDLNKLFEISKDEYTTIKFGKTWSTLESVYTECVQLANGEYLTCIFHDSTIIHHDIHGNKIQNYNIGHFDTGFDITYSIDLDKNGNLWIAQPTSHFVGLFSLEAEEELFSIGGDHENPQVFNHPEQVRVFGNYVFVSDMGNKRICKINVDTKELAEYKIFDEPTWEYGQFKTTQIVKLTSGVYQF